MVQSIQIILCWHPQLTVFCAAFILVFSLPIVIWITDRHWEKLNGTQELLDSYSRVRSSPIQTRDQFFLLLQTSFVKAKTSPWLLLPQVSPLKLGALLPVCLTGRGLCGSHATGRVTEHIRHTKELHSRESLRASHHENQYCLMVRASTPSQQWTFESCCLPQGWVL